MNTFSFIKSNPRIYLSVLLVSCHTLIFSQNGFFLSGSIDFGSVGNSYSFAKNGTILKKDWIGTDSSDNVNLLFSPELNFDYFFKEKFGVSLNLKLNDKAAVFHDAKFLESNNIKGVEFKSNRGKLNSDSGNFNPNRNYLSPNISFQYHFIRDVYYLMGGPYIKYGLGYNYLLSKNNFSTLSYYHESSNEFLKLDLEHRKGYFYHFIELGFIGFNSLSSYNSKKAAEGLVWDLGFRYTFARNYMFANYQVSKNDNILYTDRLYLGGSYFAVVLKVGGSILKKQYNTIHASQNEKSLFEKEKYKKENSDKIAEIHKRDTITKQEIIVSSKTIEISVWDHLKYDKDIILLELNGEIILFDYTLQKSKKTISINLDKKLNSLTLYALSEGQEVPCTVAVSVKDGKTEQQIIMNSTLNQSEVLKIRLNDK